MPERSAISTTRIALIRHGETVWNVAGRWQGHLDSDLTATGEAQGAAIAAALAHQGGWMALYSSDLGRACATAAIIGRVLDLPMTTLPDLRERHLGICQGLTATEMAERHPAELERLRIRDPEHVIPEGESRRACSERCTSAVARLAAAHPGGQIVVVTHGGVLDHLFRWVVGIPLEADRRWGIPNAGFCTIIHDSAGWRLETWGAVDHLGGLAPRDDADSRA